MVGSALKRINKEIKDFFDDPPERTQLFGFIKDILYGVLQGPPNSLYENGFFQFTIKFSNDYPWKPPRFLFQTKIFHPYINEEFGSVYLDILKDQWCPAITIQKIIFYIHSLLYEPNPDDDDGMNDSAVKLYKTNRMEYEKTVREYTSKYANFSTVQNELKKLNFAMKLSN